MDETTRTKRTIARHGGPPIRWEIVGIDGRLEVNRPFYAFGVLLAFLALAMLAVGLSSRPQRQPATAGGASQLPSPRRSLGGVAYLLVVPADACAGDEEADAAAGDLADCEQPTYAVGCGLDRATGRIYLATCDPSKPHLHSAIVALVERPLALETAASLDCRAHYDLAYDAIVYGPANQNPLPTWDSETADPTLTLFNSLLGESFPVNRADRPALSPRRTRSAHRSWQYQLQALARGIGNRLWVSAERMGLSDEWQRTTAWTSPAVAFREASWNGPSWADYEAWIASLQPTVRELHTPEGKKADIPGLRWRQVLQIAVAWLNHAAKTLDAVADRLADAAEAGAAEQVGVRSTNSQPR